MFHQIISRLRVIIATLYLIILPFQLHSQTPGPTKSGEVMLPNGWKLSPAGETLHLGDLPLNIAVSHSEKLLAITNNGESDQLLQLIDIKGKTILDSVYMGKSWLGLAFSDNDKFLYVSGGNDNWIVKFALLNNHLVPNDTIIIGKPWPVRISIAGLALDDPNQTLYAVTRENNSLYVIDLKTK
jgi:DNA-binding beta-propeller fold protein YncE